MSCLNCPTLTDVSELFTQQFLDESLPTIYCHMKSLLIEGAKELAYLYKSVIRDGE